MAMVMAMVMAMDVAIVTGKVDDWFKEVDGRRDAKFKGSQSSEHEAAWREMDEDDSRVGNVFAQQLRDG